MGRQKQMSKKHYFKKEDHPLYQYEYYQKIKDEISMYESRFIRWMIVAAFIQFCMKKFTGPLYLVTLVVFVAVMMILESTMEDDGDREERTALNAFYSIEWLFPKVVDAVLVIIACAQIILVTKFEKQYVNGGVIYGVLSLLIHGGVIWNGIALHKVLQFPYVEKQTEILRAIKKMKVEQLVLLINMTKQNIASLDYDRRSGRIMLQERDLLEIFGETRTRAFLESCKNRVFLIEENDAGGVEKVCEQILGVEGSLLNDLLSRVTILNCGSETVLPVKYRYYESLFYTKVYSEYEPNLHFLNSIWSDRDDLSEIQAFAREKEFQLRVNKVWLVLFCGVAILEGVVLFRRWAFGSYYGEALGIYLAIWIWYFVYKKNKTKKGLYNKNRHVDIFMILLGVHAFCFSVFWGYVEVLVLWKIRRGVEKEERRRNEEVEKEEYITVDRKLKQELNQAFKEPARYCQMIEEEAWIKLPNKFSYEPLHVFFQNALFFPNAARSAMALLDYIEMCLRLKHYSLAVEENKKQILPRREIVSINFKKMGEKIYLAAKKEGETELDRIIHVRELEKCMVAMLEKELNIDFQGEKIDFVGLISVVNVVRNKLIAHGVMREENKNMLWTFLVYAALQLTVFLNMAEFRVIENADIGGYKIGYGDKLHDAGKYLINSEGKLYIASSMDKKKNMCTYTNYFSGDLIVPEFVEETID